MLREFQKEIEKLRKMLEDEDGSQGEEEGEEGGEKRTGKRTKKNDS